MTESTQSRLLTSDDAADRLSVSVSTVKRMLREGELPGIKLKAGWRIREDALSQFITSEEERLVHLRDERRQHRDEIDEMLRNFAPMTVIVDLIPDLTEAINLLQTDQKNRDLVDRLDQHLYLLSIVVKNSTISTMEVKDM